MRDEKLMKYLDGELSPGEARRFEAELTEADLAKLESLRLVGDAVRDDVAASADDVEAKLAAMWGKLETQLAAPEAARAEQPAATPEWAKPRVPAATATATAQPGFMGWMTSKWSHGVTTMMGVAAGALIALSIAGRGESPAEKIVYVTEPSAEATATAAMDFAPPEVESLEVSGGSGSIFTIPGDEGDTPTTVIWVSREDAPEEPI